VLWALFAWLLALLVLLTAVLLLAASKLLSKGQFGKVWSGDLHDAAKVYPGELI
jgi:hypothetical protein